jgi:ferredoxin
MPRLTIDGRAVEVPAGATLLEAARAAGVEIPTLCHLGGFAPDPSCFVCVVQVEGQAGMVPSCAAPAADGLAVQTATEDVLAARRMALELLLSDHTGDCVAPCTLACPAHLDVADFVSCIKAGDHRRAVEVIKRTIALPAALGRICPRFCERSCRRKELDEPVAICSLRRFAADLDLESGEPFVPEKRAATGKRAAIVGAGPAGLAAAYYLLQEGHGCTLYEVRAEPGGLFRYGVGERRLPAQVLDAEIEIVRRLGADIRCNAPLVADHSAAGTAVTLDQLRRDYDAVLLAIGPQVRGESPAAFSPAGHAAAGQIDLEFIRRLGFEASPRGLKVDRQTLAAAGAVGPGIFAAGGVVSGPNYGVHAVAAGRRAALTMDQFLRSQTVSGEAHTVNVLLHDLSAEEVSRLHAGASPARRAKLPAEVEGGAERGLTETEARTEAGRCLDCDCGKRRDCLLRDLAARHGAAPGRHRGARREFRRDASHPEIVYESGKCIQCGRCLRVAEAAGEPLGLAFVGRGFSVRVAAAFDQQIALGLRAAGRRAAQVCPTGALSLKRALRGNGGP